MNRNLHEWFVLAGLAIACWNVGETASAQPKPADPEPGRLNEFANSIGMKMMPIKAGEFTMGDDDWHNNKPHPVRITKPFFMQAMLVTQAQYSKVMGKNPSHFKEGDPAVLPVDSISWASAQEFVKNLNALPEERNAGRTYRLPTEAEWEFCCRAGTKTKYWYGNNPDPTKMNFGESKIGKPTPVDKYAPNPWGLHDMHGNLYQPCEDSYDKSIFPADVGRDDPVNRKGDFRVMRGGAFGDIQRRCQAAYRGRDANPTSPTVSRFYFGLRVVCNAP
ncbi:MAG: formylglycine-generating enzyme family protein [Planctomycetota bacterium]